MNKLSGGMLFIFPLLIRRFSLEALGAILGFVVLLSAIEEFFIIINMIKIDRNKKYFYQKEKCKK